MLERFFGRKRTEDVVPRDEVASNLSPDSAAVYIFKDLLNTQYPYDFFSQIAGPDLRMADGSGQGTRGFRMPVTRHGTTVITLSEAVAHHMMSLHSTYPIRNAVPPHTSHVAEFDCFASLDRKELLHFQGHYKNIFSATRNRARQLSDDHHRYGLNDAARVYWGTIIQEARRETRTRFGASDPVLRRA